MKTELHFNKAGNRMEPVTGHALPSLCKMKAGACRVNTKTFVWTPPAECDIEFVCTIQARHTHINWQKKDHRLLVSDTESKMVIELLESRLLASLCLAIRGTIY